MQNGYKVVWSPRAKSDFDNKVNWLLENWSDKEIRQFVKAVDDRINLICQSPYLFPKTRKKSAVRKSVMKYYTILYYRVTKKEIHLLTLFDPRQNPAKQEIYK